MKLCYTAAFYFAFSKRMQALAVLPLTFLDVVLKRADLFPPPSPFGFGMTPPSASVDGGPAGIFTYIDENDIVQLWATESNIGSIGRLQIRNGVEVSNREKVGPNSPAGSTWGIIRTSDGHIWVADSGRNLLYELTAPYIRRTYMATIENNQVLAD